MGALLHDLAHPGYTSANLDMYKNEDNYLVFLVKDDKNFCKINI